MFRFGKRALVRIQRHQQHQQQQQTRNISAVTATHNPLNPLNNPAQPAQQSSSCRHPSQQGNNLTNRYRPSQFHKQPLLSQKRRFANVGLVCPGMGDSITEGTVVSWQKNVGDYVEVDDVVVLIETDKITVDVRATEAGELKEIKANTDDVVEIGAELCVIDTDGVKPVASAAPSKPKPVETPSVEPATPKAPPQPVPAAPKPVPTAAATTPAPSVQGGVRTERRVKISRMRARIAERLKEAQNTAACLTTFNEIDCSALKELRSAHREEFLEKHGVKLGFMSAFVKAATAALLDQPAVNARMEEKEIVYHDYVDISVAVASPTGLVVPVLRNCEQMSFADIERQINEYAQKARDGTIALEEMSGGTFTISNGGVFKSFMGTPIINPPQTAILGMHGIFDRPVAVNGKIEIRPMMNVALTYDHRLIDGREATTFVRKVKQCIEDPRVMLLDL